MLRNYLLVVLRGMRRDKGITFINVFGLAVGLACYLLIMLFIQDELSYDRQHPTADRLFRITNQVATSGDERQVAVTPAIYAPSAAASIPSVEAFLRIHPAMETMTFRRGEVAFIESDVVYADSSFFDMLGFPLADGDPARALAVPYSIVLTPELAARYFGREDPIGQTLRLNERDNYTVTGVLAEKPRQTHLRFDALLSYKTLESMSDVWQYGAGNAFLTSWHLAAGYSYLRLTPDASPEEVATRMTQLVMGSTPAGGPRYQLGLQPAQDIHLRSDLLYEMDVNGNVVYVWIFGIVALFMLGIACINYLNISTARSIKRTGEVGVRKALGADRRQLMGQFLTESAVVLGAACMAAYAMASWSLPLFNKIAGKDFSASVLLEPSVLVAFVAATAVAGIAAGCYPAFMLSRLEATDGLKDARGSGHGSAWLRRGLVVFQFAAAVALLLGTTTVYQQLTYIQDKDLGFDQEHIVTFQLPEEVELERLETIKSRLAEHPGVLAVGAASGLPTIHTSRHNTWPEGELDEEPQLLSFYGVDHDFIETLGFEIAEGRAFSRAFPTDSTEAYLLNEAATRHLGWEGSALGREFAWARSGGRQIGRVIGVVKDFHYESLRVTIEPAFFALTPEQVGVVAVRTDPNRIQSALTHMEQVTGEFFPANPFAYEFLDERLHEVYAAEERLGTVVGIFTILTMLIACMGLFGLATHAVEQRRQEIGIRKVLGATAQSIVALLSKDFLKLVLIGFVLAAPAAYYVMSRWLEDFAYRIDIGAGVFILTGIIVLAIALLTVSYQALKAAWMNPTEAIRNE